MIKNVIIKNDRIEVHLISGEILFLTIQTASELKDYLNELL